MCNLKTRNLRVFFFALAHESALRSHGVRPEADPAQVDFRWRLP